MGWFSKKEPDAIDRLCESLKERWWEWTPYLTQRDDPAVRSVSGLFVLFAHSTAYLGYTDAGAIRVPEGRDEQIKAAYRQMLVSRMNSKKADFGDTAEALAQAVLRGDRTAAIGLADWVKENLGEIQ